MFASVQDNGVMPKYGLAEAGKQQAKQAGKKLRDVSN